MILSKTGRDWAEGIADNNNTLKRRWNEFYLYIFFIVTELVLRFTREENLPNPSRVFLKDERREMTYIILNVKDFIELVNDLDSYCSF